MASTPLRQQAIDYLLAHQAEHLHHDRKFLVNRCTSHLQQIADITTERANVATLQALGELDSTGSRARIDVDHGTSFVVFVVDPVTRVKVAFTAADLLRLARADDRHHSALDRASTTH
jgi:hypothetical protein